MADVNIYKILFEKKIIPFLGSRKSEQERMIFYIKLYTHLIIAPEELKSRRGYDRLKVVYDLTRSASFSGESHYIKYINNIVKDILANRRRIQALISKDPVSDPFHVKTRLLTAQNICMLRILKISGV